MPSNYAKLPLYLLVLSVVVGCGSPRAPREKSPEMQFQELEKTASKEASDAVGQYGSCVMASTRLYDKSNDPPSDIADAIHAKCQESLDKYEAWVGIYFGAIARGRDPGVYRAQARRSKEEIRETMKREAIAAIIDDRMKR